MHDNFSLWRNWFQSFLVPKVVIEKFCLLNSSDVSCEVWYFAGEEGLNLIQLMMLCWRQIILGSVKWWDQCHGVLYSLFGLSLCFCFLFASPFVNGMTKKKKKITLVSELFYASNYVTVD